MLLKILTTRRPSWTRLSELKRRATVNVLADATELTHGHNQSVDGGVLRNYFNLSDPGSKAITEMLLNDGEEELKLITGSRLPAKCGDVRKYFIIVLYLTSLKSANFNLLMSDIWLILKRSRTECFMKIGYIVSSCILLLCHALM